MKALFFAAIVLLSLTSYSQTKGAIKLYGFKQSVSGGKAPELSEDGTTKTIAKPRKNYLIYAASLYRIYPVEIWIEGTRYGVSIKSITNTPVEYGDDGNIGAPKKVLVPATSKKIIQLIPIAATAAKAVGTKAKSLATSNELVLVYKQNGKFYYTNLKSLTEMNSAAMN